MIAEVRSDLWQKIFSTLSTQKDLLREEKACRAEPHDRPMTALRKPDEEHAEQRSLCNAINLSFVNNVFPDNQTKVFINRIRGMPVAAIYHRVYLIKNIPGFKAFAEDFKLCHANCDTYRTIMPKIRTDLTSALEFTITTLRNRGYSQDSWHENRLLKVPEAVSISENEKISYQ